MPRWAQVFLAFIVVICISALLAACGGQPPALTPAKEAAPTFTPEPSSAAAPALSGPTLVEQRCTACHTLDRIKQSRKSEADWRATVERMVNKGAALSSEEIEVVIRYLAQTYPR